MVKSEFLTILKERGFFHQCTDEEGLDNLCLQNNISAYIGFDCTAKSLHVGSLMQIMILRILQKCGHTPIILLGGATTKIGDPTGKDESRPAISDETIAENLTGIKQTLEKFGISKAIFVNNYDWISKLSLIDMLDISRNFSVNRMLALESVKIRLERELEMSLLEFNYMVIQAYDFLELSKQYNCRLQIGGSDQWGNILGGIDLHRRIHKKEILSDNTGKGKDVHTKRIEQEKQFVQEQSLFGLTTPLITTSSGSKMGKTASGAVWLDSSMLPPYDYWQFWRNTEDKDVGRFLRFFTDLTLEEITKLEQLQGADINKAKIILANEATKICHGEDAAIQAEQTAKQVFEQGSMGTALPTIEIEKQQLEEGIEAFKVLQIVKLVSSSGEARRLIKGGGARLNDVKITSNDQLISINNLDNNGTIKISAGKKKHAILKVLN